MIQHTKTFLVRFFHPGKEISSKTKLSQSLEMHPGSPQTSFFTSKYDLNTNLSRNISIFPSLGLGLGLQLRSNRPLSRNWYISLRATARVAYYFYFCVLCNYYHTNKYGVVLENIYYSQVFHTN